MFHDENGCNRCIEVGFEWNTDQQKRKVAVAQWIPVVAPQKVVA